MMTTTTVRAEENWKRLVQAALRASRGPGHGAVSGGLAATVPSSLNAANIDAILNAADEIQAEDANVARILCEHAYTMAQNLDPNSEGRGVLQFKTGLMSLIKQKLSKREGVLDRSQDLARIQEFYKHYREKHKVDELQEEELRMQESGTYSGDYKELEKRARNMKRVFATLKVLGDVVEAMTSDVAPDQAEALIPEQLKRVIKSDAEKTEGLYDFNIVPLDAPAMANPISLFPEVKAAISALSSIGGLPSLPVEYEVPQTRKPDILDLLQYTFGFQKDNVKNQREHVVLLLSNAQARLRIPEETDPKLDEAAVHMVFQRSLENYFKWCSYLNIPRRHSSESIQKEKKLMLVSLYFLIWGEAANVRFLPECICYLFYQMSRELDEIMEQQFLQPAKSCIGEDGVSFLQQVILPLYESLAAESAVCDNGKEPHSAWRNYDDFNEYFWSRNCFELGWPWNKESSPFLFKPSKKESKVMKISRRRHGMGKTCFVEHRTFFHLYHSFHRLWIFLAMMFQALTIIGFNDSKISWRTVRELLSVGPTFMIMKFIESILDIVMMYGAYAATRSVALSRIFLRFLWFGALSGFISYLYVKGLQDYSARNSSSFIFRVYVVVLGIYAVSQLLFSFLMRIPACHMLTERCDKWSLVRFLKWMHQEHYYVGRGLYERPFDYLRYVFFWIIIFGCKFAFAYFLEIRPLIAPTRTILRLKALRYSWHDLVSRNNHNALTIASLWAPVFAVYILDFYIWYTVLSAIVGALIGAKERLGEIQSIAALHKRFATFPEAFVKSLQVAKMKGDGAIVPHGQVNDDLQKRNYVSRFSPFWNEIIKCLREEDYITNREKELLCIPSNSGRLTFVQWPLFLLVSKIFLAQELAAENDSQASIWEKVSKDEYMKYAVSECYSSVENILKEILDEDGKLWVNRVFNDIRASIEKFTLPQDFQLGKLSLVLSRIIGLTGLLVREETADTVKGAVQALQDLYDVVTHDILSYNIREHYDTWRNLAKARIEGRLFSKIGWPKDSELKQQIKRLHLMLTVKESAANIPKNLEARRRLEFFTNSLFMKMPSSRLVREMLSFSVFTPYYSETVMYSMNELNRENEDGISTLFYLQKIFPDEWKNFLERIGRDDLTRESELQENPTDLLELRLWASYRGQTLARTVRGMMYYRKALVLQSYIERLQNNDIENGMARSDIQSIEDYELSRDARAQADLKFTYVITCQIYGKQKQDKKPEAADIALLMQRNEALRVAFIDVVETLKDGKVHKEFYSKLVKADVHGKDKEIYSIKLPGDPKLGEGKPENQNHAIIFTRGNAVQTIDMNQDNYFEEALKMRNLLEEFDCDHGLRPATILGVREHVFTGSVSSLASFMSNQESSFVTMGQRVLASLKVRMHYGHPDVFDRIFHITRGGISKASRIINISEDIYAGFNSTLRQGNITHHEYIQVGKGRDVGLNQIAMFEGKVAGGNGEQVLSRDVYRLGQLFDFFRMLSFYHTTVGYYFCTMLTVLTVYVFLYGKAYLALSGVGGQIRDRVKNNASLDAALNTQFLFQIGVFTAVPMIMGFILEQGLLKAIVSFVTMQLQLCTVFFTFSLGTRAHYFGRTILHGGAKYRATGRGFVVQHIKFAENYRLYSRSHFVKALEVAMLLLVYTVYGYIDSGVLSYILVTFSSWFLVISWLFAPYIFNPSGFEWQKTVKDFEDWTNWLLYRGGIGVKGEESWEAWWDEEQAHIRSIRGRIFETILSLRFFMFQYGIVYKLNATGRNTSLTVYGFSWLVLLGLILIFKVFTFSQKVSVNFQLLLRFVQGATFISVIIGLGAVVVFTDLTIGDLFASILAFIPTGWALLSIAIAWKPIIKRLGLWKSVRSLARLYDAGMGMVVFIPIAICSWLPFISTFQTRLMYNQAFSRGLEISLILAGNKQNFDDV